MDEELYFRFEVFDVLVESEYFQKFSYFQVVL